MHEVYGRLGANEEKYSVTKFRDAAIAVGIASVGLVTLTLLIAREFYSARERRT